MVDMEMALETNTDTNMWESNQHPGLLYAVSVQWALTTIYLQVSMFKVWIVKCQGCSEWMVQVGILLYMNTDGSIHWAKKATIHQVTTMLATFKHALFPGHNHLLTTSADDPSLWISPWHSGNNPIIKVNSTLHFGYRLRVSKYRWLAGGYDLK